MTITLLRHGLTEANEKKLYYGKTDIFLSENGKNELIKLKTEGIYKNLNPKLFISSGAKRSVETLEILFNILPDYIIPELGEYDFGIFEMKSHDELNGNEFYQNWLTDIVAGKDEYKIPEGESRTEYKSRIIIGLDKLLKISEDNETLAVLHGGSISFIMKILFPDEKNYYEWLPSAGRGYKIEMNGNEKKYYLV